MPDITMCKGLDHPKCNTCYRKVATPNEYRQSYFTDIPIQHPNSSNPICTWYRKATKLEEFTLPPVNLPVIGRAK